MNTKKDEHNSQLWDLMSKVFQHNRTKEQYSFVGEGNEHKAKCIHCRSDKKFFSHTSSSMHLILLANISKINPPKAFNAVLNLFSHKRTNTQNHNFISVISQITRYSLHDILPISLTGMVIRNGKSGAVIDDPYYI